MKRVNLLSAASLILAMASCQNEEVAVLQQEHPDGQLFTLQATYGGNTRTTLEQNGNTYQTNWSAGDQIYVTDGNGLVAGVLSLVDGEGENCGTFTGVVTGNPAALRYAIFPVPENGMTSLNTTDAGETDAPMTATISGNSAEFANECGLVRLLIYNLPEDANIKLSAEGIAGTLQINTQNGISFSQEAAADEIVIKNANSGKEFFVPVWASGQVESATFTLSVNDASTTFTASIKKGAVSVNGIPELYVSGDKLVDLNDLEESGEESDIVIEEIENNGSEDVNTSFESAVTSDAKEIIVKLNADVTYDVAAWANDAMGGEKTEKITIIGNGHTITFNQTNSDWNNIVTNGATLAIHDARITSSGYNNGPWNRHDLNFACDVELTDVFSDKAIALKAGGKLTDVTIDDANTSDTYAVWIQPNGQTVTLDRCMIDMLDCTDGRGIKIDEQYVESPDKVILNVSNTTFKTEEKSAILIKSEAGADITLSNIDISEVAADNKNAVWVDEASAQYYDLVAVTGGSKIQEP